MRERLNWKRLGLTVTVPALAVLALSIAAPAEAQVHAAVVTTDGERHEGRNLGYRLDEREVAVRVDFHTEPRIPIDRVAMIEFGPTEDRTPPEQLEQERGGEHLLVTRDGRLYRGRLLEASHEDRGDETTPYLVTFQTPREELRLDVSEVSRVFLGDVSQALADPADPARDIAGLPDDDVVVSSREQWTPTGVTVTEGEVVTFEASGQVQLSNDPNDVASPAGSLTGRHAADAPMPHALAGALIGRVGEDGEPFAIGDQTQVPMPASGELFLGVNDDVLEDNRGEFRVSVDARGPAPTR